MGDPTPPRGAGTDLAYISADDVDGMTVADVMHARVASLPATATVGKLRARFAVSPSRRLAVLTDVGRYARALTSADVAPAACHDRPAIEVAREYATLAPDLPAAASATSWRRRRGAGCRSSTRRDASSACSR